jgi:hypothetical protein
MVLKAVDQARASPFPLECGWFGRIRKALSRSRAPSVFFATFQQLRHRGLRITCHSSADAFQKAVVPGFPSSDGLIVGVPRRFRNAGEQCLHKRIDEPEKGLLPELDPPNLAGKAVKAGCDSFFSRINSALAPGQLTLNRSSHESGRAREAAISGSALYAPDQHSVDSQSAAYRMSLVFSLHRPYALTSRARDKSVHDCARIGEFCARRNCNARDNLHLKNPQTVQQPFMFHYPSFRSAWSLLLRSHREKPANF